MNTIFLPDGTWFNVGDTNIVSDGYHTFGELYEHRCLLFAWVISAIGANSDAYRDLLFKTRKNSVGVEWVEWFIAGINMPEGQVAYHLPMSMWDLVHAPEIDCIDRYDGYTSDDVVKRIRAILEMQR